MDSDTLGFAVGIAFFLLFVAAGITFVGNDGGTGAGTGAGADTEPSGASDADPPDYGGETNTTEDDEREVAVLTDSLEIEPHEIEPNGSKEPDVSDLDTDEVERLVVERTNEIRRNRSLETVAHAGALSSPARNHSMNMSREDYLGHFEPSGEGPEGRYVEACASLRDGKEPFEVGENVAAVGYKAIFRPTNASRSALLVTEEGVARYLVREWMESTPHRRNLLEPGWRTVGVGVVVDDNGRVFGTQVFCSVDG